MKNNDVDIFETAQYYEIICGLIYSFNIVSQIKLIFLSFAIYNLEFSFESNRKEYGLLNDVLIGIKFGIQKNFYHFETIFDCIDLLKRKKMIEEQKGKILILSTPNFTNTNSIMTTPLLKRVIAEVEKLSDESLIRGVIEYV